MGTNLDVAAADQSRPSATRAAKPIHPMRRIFSLILARWGSHSFRRPNVSGSHFEGINGGHQTPTGPRRHREGRWRVIWAGSCSSMYRSEGSRRIAGCRVKLHAWLEHARAWDEACFKANAVGVLEQHRIVTRRPCFLLRGLDHGGPNLSKQIVQAIHVLVRTGSQAKMVQANTALREAMPSCAGTAGWMPIAVRAPTQ